MNQSGESNNHWKGGTSDYWRREARKITKCPEGLIVHHIDGDWKNNNIKNLQIISQSEHVGIHNTQRKGTIKPMSIIRQVIKSVIELKNNGYERKEIANILNIKFRMVKRCLTTEWRCQYE